MKPSAKRIDIFNGFNDVFDSRKQPEMIHVFLDGSFPTGHHEFADSVNNGPWGRVLTEEFIPLLEKRFRLVAKPYARFLTGHSSGGWSTLWLQVTYPNFSGGKWSTAPDPVDFREFTGSSRVDCGVQMRVNPRADFYHLTFRTGSPNTSRRGSMPRPGLAEADNFPARRSGAPVAMLTVT